MRSHKTTPADLAVALGQRARQTSRGSIWRRETFVLPREEARAEARIWLERFPKAAYMSEVEAWRELADGRIEFTMRRLPSAD